MDYLDKKFDIDLAKISNFMETSLDMCDVYLIEMAGYDDNFFLEEAKPNALQKIKSGFQKLIKIVVDFIKKVYNAAVVKITQKKIQYKLRRLKKDLAQHKSTLKSFQTGQEVSYKEIKSYVKDYERFIDDFVKFLKDLYKFDFDSVEELEKKFTDFVDLLDEKYDKMLNCTELMILASGVMEQLELTDKEITEMNKYVARISEKNNKAIESLGDMSEEIWSKVAHKILKESADGNQVDVNTNAIETKKVKLFQRASQKIANTTKKVVKVVCNHPVDIMILVSKDYAKHYDDKKYRQKKEKFDTTMEEIKAEKNAARNAVKDKYLNGED